MQEHDKNQTWQCVFHGWFLGTWHPPKQLYLLFFDFTVCSKKYLLLSSRPRRKRHLQFPKNQYLVDLRFFAKHILYVIRYMRYRRALGLLNSETDFSDLLFSPPSLTQKTTNYLKAVIWDGHQGGGYMNSKNWPFWGNFRNWYRRYLRAQTEFLSKLCF